MTAPLDVQPPLYRTFSQLATGEDIRAFANQYGLLGIPRDPASTEEHFHVWFDEPRHLMVVLEAWWAIAGKPSPNWADVFFPPARAGALDDDEPRDTDREKNPVKYVRSWLERLTNERLLAHVSALLEPASQPKGPFRMVFRPKNLIGGIWLQCAKAMTGESDLRECRRCGKALHRPGQRRLDSRRRPDANFCSDICRASYHQSRHAQARRMLKDGQSIREIATAMQQPTATIGRWVR